MKKLQILLGLIILSIVLTGLNVNSAFIFGNPPQLINAYNNNNLVRLHVIANSNSPRDQYLKRVIREEVTAYLTDCPNEEGLKEKLPSLEVHLNELLLAEKAGYPAKINYGVYEFPRRTYEELTLPPGDYSALRVVLGKGQGSNWWCVLLPPLCVERSEGSQNPENKSITGKYEFRFKLVEVVKKNSLARQLLQKITRLVY